MVETDKEVKRSKGALSWAMWDWASQSFPTVITSFVFSVYITSQAFAPDGMSEGEFEQFTGTWLGLSGTIAGIIIALIAPIVGRRSDATGRKKLWLFVNTYLFAIMIGLMFFVAPSNDFFFFGLTLLALGGIFFEFATVNYNAMLSWVSSPSSRGKISQFGWGLGYMGGILLLVIALFIIQFGGAALLGIPDEQSLPVRVVMLISMVWVLIFSIPLLINVPETPPAREMKKVSIIQSYLDLFKKIGHLARHDRNMLVFLVGSAVYRDGLNGVFAYGAVLGSLAFGLSLTEVILFGIAANVVAGAGAFGAALVEDRYGSKRVMLFSIMGVMIGGFAVFVFADWGVSAFFIFGLLLSTFVGPAQAAGRTMLSRLSKDDEQGEMFGLYATTGRSISFLAPLAWTVFVGSFGAIYGILGLMVVLGAGFLVMLLVKDTRYEAEASQ
jgi:UMF1 family MFS transporter